MASKKPKLTNKICATPNCGKGITARGFCPACYYRLLRKGVLKSGSQTNRFRHRLKNIDSVNKTANCLVCGDTKIYHRGKNRWRCATESSGRSRLYKQAYREERKQILKKKCEICNTSDNLCFDHNHKTNEYRGTLCKRCNTAIGMLDEKISNLRKAIEYLSK